MNKEIEYINKKELSEKETLLFYLDIGDLPEVALSKMGLNVSEIPYVNLVICIKILNEGWYPNWKDKEETKYYNYFDLESGFSCWGTTYRTTATIVPSALCFSSSELAKQASTYLIDLYKQVYE
jgi:hypothetical protein